ncbi:IclR family transcriptional regulator [Salicibibacter cibi]|uniref:IclR family transcriptional regulator n=1 Tax=Salicibibacter cibi TaxID=2743001 RepID=A0A7T6ZE58_9BACI|nr:IclR family transcriptional regulator [Salicibibacter cibi]QQK81727.1 IclR family transcriptional regulator [Salicibibacter cibi]
MEKERVKGLRTVHRSIRLLNCFTVDETELSLTEICTKLELPKSTTARLIETLIETEMLQRNDHNFKYKLGHNVYTLGRVAEKSNDIVRLAAPFMKQLREDTGESVTLYKIERDKRICLERFVSNQPISHNVTVGTRLDLDIGSAGKALLAFQDDLFVEKILKRQEFYGRMERLWSELKEIKKTNITKSYDERGTGVNAVSSAIYNMTGQVKFALCVSGPSVRFTKEKMDRWGSRVQKDAASISSSSGYEPEVKT